MGKTSTKKIYNEIEFNERRLLLLLSNDLLWFKKNLVNIKNHKNRKNYLHKKTERYNKIFKTTQELAALSDKITKTDSDVLTSPYVYLEQEKLSFQKIKVNGGVKVKNLSKPKLFEVITFTHYVDLFNNPKSRKYPKEKCVKLIENKILDKSNNLPSCKLAREYYLAHTEEAQKVINAMFVDSALYLKKDMELEMQIKNKTRAKKQEKAIEEHNNLTKQRTTIKQKAKAKKEETVFAKTPLTPVQEKPKTKVKYNGATKTYEFVYDDEDELTK